MAPEQCVNQVMVMDAWKSIDEMRGEERAEAVLKTREFSDKHQTVEYGMLVDVCKSTHFTEQYENG